jgi:hypothetical protein
MRVQTAIAALGLAGLAACAGPARQPGEPPHYYIPPDELLGIYGTYQLSNGDTLKISREHRRYWAEMRTTGRFEIVPRRRDVFEQKGGPMLFEFSREAFTTDVLIYGLYGPAAPPVAAFVRRSNSGIERKFSE